MTAAPATKAAIQRAIAAAQAAGLVITAVVIGRDGSVRIEAGHPESLDHPPEAVQPLRPKQWATR